MNPIVSVFMGYAINSTLTIIAIIYLIFLIRGKINWMPFITASFFTASYWSSGIYTTDVPDYRVIYFQYASLEIGKLMCFILINYLFKDFSKISWIIIALLLFNTSLFLIFDTLNHSDSLNVWFEMWMQFYEIAINVSDILMCSCIAAYYWLRPRPKYTVESEVMPVTGIK